MAPALDGNLSNEEPLDGSLSNEEPLRLSNEEPLCLSNEEPLRGANGDADAWWWWPLWGNISHHKIILCLNIISLIL